MARLARAAWDRAAEAVQTASAAATLEVALVAVAQPGKAAQAGGVEETVPATADRVGIQAARLPALVVAVAGVIVAVVAALGVSARLVLVVALAAAVTVADLPAVAATMAVLVAAVQVA